MPSKTFLPLHTCIHWHTISVCIIIIILSHAALGVDYANPASQTLTFSQGSTVMGSTDTVTYSVLGDGAFEGAHDFNVGFVLGSSLSGIIVGGDPTTINIDDNEGEWHSV